MTNYVFKVTVVNRGDDIVILHVNDDIYLAEIVCRFLVKAGYQVLSFSSLQEAKIRANSGGISLFLCDGSIEERYDGWNWAKELHQEGKKVVVLSGERVDMHRELSFYHKDNLFLFDNPDSELVRVIRLKLDEPT